MNEIRIPLNINDDEHGKIFIDYFNSALTRQAGDSTGSAGFSEDGTFFSAVHKAGITWKLTILDDGTIPYVDATISDAAIRGGWDGSARDFVIGLLAQAMQRQKEHFCFRRQFYYVGPNLNGEYWMSGIRFAPAIPNDSDPQLYNAERVVYIDLPVTAIDVQYAATKAAEIAHGYAALFSLLADIGLYEVGSELCWGTDPDTREAMRHWRGYTNYAGRLASMPEEGLICHAGEFQGSILDQHKLPGLVALPSETQKIVQALGTLSLEKRRRIDACAKMYMIARSMGQRLPSLQAAYMVAAVEALSKADTGFRGFSDFVRKMTGTTDKFVLNYFHGKLRSGHFHSGDFHAGDFTPPRIGTQFFDRDDLIARDIQLKGYALIRLALLKWLYKETVVGSQDVDRTSDHTE